MVVSRPSSTARLDKSLIEFKLAKPTSLKRNLQNQVEIYEKANRTDQSMKVIIAYTDADLAKVAEVLAELELTGSPAVVVIGARAGGHLADEPPVHTPELVVAEAVAAVE
jgi:hypothetical protein